MAFEHLDSREIGRWLDGSAVSLDLGTGTTKEVFQAVGTVPVLIEMFKSFVRTGPCAVHDISVTRLL